MSQKFNVLYVVPANIVGMSVRITTPLLLILAISGLALSSEPAPRFHAQSMDGEKFSNESTKGKVVLVQFWATWCKYCRAEQPLVDQLHREFADQGLVVLAVDFMEPKKTVKKYLAEAPRACKVVLTEDTNLAAMYPSRSFPFYVLIDRDGNVAGTQRGAGGEHSLRSLLRKAGLE